MSWFSIFIEFHSQINFTQIRRIESCPLSCLTGFLFLRTESSSTEPVQFNRTSSVPQNQRLASPSGSEGTAKGQSRSWECSRDSPKPAVSAEMELELSAPAPSLLLASPASRDVFLAFLLLLPLFYSRNPAGTALLTTPWPELSTAPGPHLRGGLSSFGDDLTFFITQVCFVCFGFYFYG